MKSKYEIKKLGEVCEISTGNSNTEDAIENGSYAFFDRSKVIKKSSKYIFDTEAIIVAGEGQTFFPKFYSGKFDLHQRAYALFNFKAGVNINYVYKYLIHFHKYFEEVAVGATAKSLRLRHFQDLPIPIPPLPEQLLIVSILDKSFESIAKAKENAEKNLKSAKEIFDSYLQSVFKNKGEGWEEKTLGEVCEMSYGYTEKAKENGEYRFVRITDTDENGLLTKEGKMYIDSFEEVNKYLIADGDLLMARTGASAGNLLLFEGNEKAVFASYLIRMNFKKEILSKLYWYFSKSKLYWSQVRQLSAGSAQPQFNGGALKQIFFPFPNSIKEQLLIVSKLDSLSSQTKKLETIYQQKLDDLEELKKSILQKAFNGELTRDYHE